MDWGRAKNILIFAFLLLNIVLGYQLWQELDDRMSTEMDWTSLSEETRQNMELHNIQVATKIPTDTPELSNIEYRLVKRDREMVPLKTPRDSKVVFSQQEMQRTFKDEIEHVEQYSHDQKLFDEKVFVLHQQMTNGLPLFDVTLKLRFSDQKITHYEQNYAIVVTKTAAKAQKIIHASQALSTVIENNLSPGSVVKDIRLGYHGTFPLYDSEQQLAGPTWRILLENGEVYYFNAIQGGVDSSQGKKEKE
ncbi:two-component system regulatory protein YycI [Paenibacillus sp. 481]|uniref:two-component system regulatory protein YycI n=1 Tax=Paenibacillus sp. 481 TaxID=2835869 RepID=UPI001E43FCAF|nr:two-component system regulatory protein YycI [Paenibacillus sp. 481]UHA75397.1 two-component system regulatory protein YycI [Paenibacillus sp. 481]